MALHRLGMIEALRGRFDVALPILRRALSLAPGSREQRLETAEVLLLDGRKAESLALIQEGLASGALSEGDIRANPGFDEVKDSAQYRQMVAGSLLDFADPCGGIEKRLLQLAEKLPLTAASDREGGALWRELSAQGTLVGDSSAAVRHLLREVTSDFLLARSINRKNRILSVHAEVHPLQDGLEIRTVYVDQESGKRAGTLSQALFRAAPNSYLVRFHGR
jgi:hypothetical protein